VLDVATSLVRAQPRTFIPFVQRFRWRWVGLSALVIMGTTTLAAVGVGIAAAGTLGRGGGGDSLGAAAARAPGLAALAVGAVLAAFCLGGIVSARMSRGRTVAESALAGLVVLALLTAAGSTLSHDAPLAAALLALPCAFVAALGGWLGEVGARKEGGP
jgi:hypothetical protein